MSKIFAWLVNNLIGQIGIAVVIAILTGLGWLSWKPEDFKPVLALWKSITIHPATPWAAGILIGFLVGVSFDRVLRRIDGRRKTELTRLGHRMESLHNTLGWYRAEGRLDASDDVPGEMIADLTTLYSALGKYRIPTIDFSEVDRYGTIGHVDVYLDHVGTPLRQGDIKLAKETAQSIKDR